ncbi:MAG: hypothetical protein R3223_13230, partial [Longimicrobiales bacterium]|nr:hypothetical protein [Longimicrobiales bacterium]
MTYDDPSTCPRASSDLRPSTVLRAGALFLVLPLFVACGGEMEEEANGDTAPFSSPEAAARPM